MYLYEKYLFYLKYHLLCQENVSARLLCHVTKVTYFNKRCDLEVKPVDL